MKSTVLSIIILVSVILTACTTNEKKNSTGLGEKEATPAPLKDAVVIKIPDDISTSQIDLSSFISEIDFIALETSARCVIRSINKVLSDEGSYIIHDKDNKAIFRFDEDGKYLNQIGIIGKGPKEYTECWDVSLDRFKKEVSVLDLSGRKIVRYKYDGSFVGTTRMKFLYTQHEYTRTGFVFRTQGSHNIATPAIDGYCLAFSDENHVITGQVLTDNKDKKNNYTTVNPLRKFSDRIYFSFPYRNEIFKIENNQAYPAFRIDFGKIGWDSGLDTDELNRQEMKELTMKYEFFNGDYVVSDNYLFFQTFGQNKAGYMVYYSLSTGAMKYGYHFNDPESSSIGLLFNSPQWLKYDDSFLSSIQPYRVIEAWEMMHESKAAFITEKEKSILQNAKEGDNPILIVYRLNEF